MTIKQSFWWESLVRLKEEMRRFSLPTDVFIKQRMYFFWECWTGIHLKYLRHTERDKRQPQGVLVDALFSSVFFPLFVCWKVKPSEYSRKCRVSNSIVLDGFLGCLNSGPRGRSYHGPHLLQAVCPQFQSSFSSQNLQMLSVAADSWVVRRTKTLWGKWWQEHQSPCTFQKVDGVLPAPTWEEAASVFSLQASELHSHHSNVLEVQFFFSIKN